MNQLGCSGRRLRRPGNRPATFQSNREAAGDRCVVHGIGRCPSPYVTNSGPASGSQGPLPVHRARSRFTGPACGSKPAPNAESHFGNQLSGCPWSATRHAPRRAISRRMAAVGNHDSSAPVRVSLPSAFRVVSTRPFNPSGTSICDSTMQGWLGFASETGLNGVLETRMI